MTRRAMRVYLAQAGVPQEESADVVLALDEACANVIRHAFPGARGRIRLRADVVDGRADVRVEDDGVGFDAKAPRARPDVYDTSGRGLRMMRELMTSVDLESPTETGGTRVVMCKTLSGAVLPP